MKSIVDQYKQYFSNENFRHLLLNMSMTSTCRKHPNAPVGWIIRDQGQLDFYAGKTRQIMTLDGEYLVIASNFALHTDTALFNTKGLSNFKILGKHFNQKLFDGQRLLAVKPEQKLASYSVIGPGTYVQNADGTVGTIFGQVPLLSIFDERLLFEDDEELNKLLPPSVEIHKMVTDRMGRGPK